MTWVQKSQRYLFFTSSLCFPFGPLVSRQDGNLPRAGGRTGGCQSKSVHAHPPHSAPTAAEYAWYSTPKESKVTVSTTASSVRHSGYWHQKRLFHQWTQETTEDDSINCIQWARRNCQMSHPCNLQRDREKEEKKSRTQNPLPHSGPAHRSFAHFSVQSIPRMTAMWVFSLLGSSRRFRSAIQPPT
jgi:hypothetical protein